MSLRTLVVLPGLVLVLCMPQARAAFNYGDISCNTVIYKQVTEDTSTDPGVALFGAPQVADDSLIFNPVSFGANASNGSIDLTDGTLATTIQALNGNRVEKIRFSERGDYTLAGNGTANTSATVSGALFVTILDIDGVGVVPISLSTNLLFSPSDGTYNLVDDRGVASIWQGGIEIDVTAAIAAAGRTGKATRVSLTLDNSLLALSEPGTIAYIKKKEMDGVSITAIVPEPATAGLLALGVLLLRRRHA